MKRILKTGAVLLISAMVALTLTSCDDGGGSGPSNNARLRGNVYIDGRLANAAGGASTFAEAIQNAAYAQSIQAATGTIDFTNIITDHSHATVEFTVFSGTPAAAPDRDDRYSLYFMALSTGDFSLLAIPGTLSYFVIRVTAQNGTTTRYYAWRVQVGAGPGPIPRLTGFNIGDVAGTPGFGQADPAVGTLAVTLNAGTPQQQVVARQGAINLTVAQVLSQSLTVTAAGAGAQITGYFIAPGDRGAIIPTGMVGAEWVELETPGLSFTADLSDLIHFQPPGFGFFGPTPEVLPHLFLRTADAYGREWFYRVVINITDRPINPGVPGVPPTVNIGGVGATLGTGSSTADVPVLQGTAGRRGTVTLTPAQAQNLTFASITGLPAGTVTGLAVGDVWTVAPEAWLDALPNLASGPHHLFIRTSVGGRNWYYRIAVTVSQPAVYGLAVTVNGVGVTLGTGGAAVNVAAADRGTLLLEGAQAGDLTIVATGGAEIQVAIGTASTTAINIRSWISNPQNPNQVTIEGMQLNDQAHLFIRTRDNFLAAFYHHRIVVSVPTRLRAGAVNGAPVISFGEGFVVDGGTPPPGFGEPPVVTIPVTPAAGVMGAITLTAAQAAAAPTFTSSYLSGTITGLAIWRGYTGEVDEEGDPIIRPLPIPLHSWADTPASIMQNQTAPNPVPTMAAAMSAFATALGVENATLQDGDQLFIRVQVPGLVSPGTFPQEHLHFYRILVTVE